MHDRGRHPGRAGRGAAGGGGGLPRRRRPGLAQLPGPDPAQRGDVRAGRPPVRLLRLRHALLRQHQLPGRRRGGRGAAARRRGGLRPGAGPAPPAHRPAGRRAGPRPGPAGRRCSGWTARTTGSTSPTRRRRCGCSPAPGRPPAQVRAGPRVGVAAAHDLPWRFWIDGSPAVSPYRPGRRRRPGVRSGPEDAEHPSGIGLAGWGGSGRGREHPRRAGVARADRAEHRPGRAAARPRRRRAHPLLRLRPHRAQPARRQPGPAAHPAPLPAGRRPADRAGRRGHRA